MNLNQRSVYWVFQMEFCKIIQEQKFFTALKTALMVLLY